MGVSGHKLTHGVTERWQQGPIQSYVGSSPVLFPGVNCHHPKGSFAVQAVEHLVTNLPFLHCAASEFL